MNTTKQLFKNLKNMLRIADTGGPLYVFLMDDVIIIDPPRDYHDQILIFLKNENFYIKDVEINKHTAHIGLSPEGKLLRHSEDSISTALPWNLVYKIYCGIEYDRDSDCLSFLKQRYIENKQETDEGKLRIHFEQSDCRIFYNS